MTTLAEFFNVKSAAAYCGFNPSYFSRLTAIFILPRYGPRRNRFKKSDLDQWMLNPSIFQKRLESARTGFRKVTI